MNHEHEHVVRSPLCSNVSREQGSRLSSNGRGRLRREARRFLVSPTLANSQVFELDRDFGRRHDDAPVCRSVLK